MMESPIIRTNNLNLYYGKFQALIDVNMAIRSHRITSIIGPSGCGKSTLLRAFNRMNDLVEGVKVTGDVIVKGENIYSSTVDLLGLRKTVGMVFQRPNPFPLSVYENVIFGLKINPSESKNRSRLQQAAEESLRAVLLWDILKDKLDTTATMLSLEEQQRLCIARVLAVKSEVLLMDEPCSALDPIATAKIEELMKELKNEYTVIVVTHNMQQAARVSDDTGYMMLGKLIEFGTTKDIFTAPHEKHTEDYITGRFG